MKIRKIKEGDRKAFIEMVRSADNRDKKWAEQKFDNFILSKKKKSMLVAVNNNELIGFAGIKGEDIDEVVPSELNKNYAKINWIAVLPKYRDDKIGSKLLKESENYAKKWKKRGIWLGCKDDVLEFYEKNNYHKRGTYMNDDGNEENIMLKELK